MKNKGFTIIEMIIYIALFGIMMGGLMVVVFQLVQSSEKLATGDNVQEEIIFVEKKLNWVLTGASDIEIISNVLKVKNHDDYFYFKKQDEKIKFCENSCFDEEDYVSLTTSNLKVEDLNFTEINTTPSGLSVDFKINGIITTYIKYLRI